MRDDGCHGTWYERKAPGLVVGLRCVQCAESDLCVGTGEKKKKGQMVVDAVCTGWCGFVL